MKGSQTTLSNVGQTPSRLDFTHEYELWSSVSHARAAARDTSGTHGGTQPREAQDWAAGKPQRSFQSATPLAMSNQYCKN